MDGGAIDQPAAEEEDADFEADLAEAVNDVFAGDGSIPAVTGLSRLRKFFLRFSNRDLLEKLSFVILSNRSLL